MAEPRRIKPVYETGYNGTGATLVKGVIVNWVTTPTIVDEIELAAAVTDSFVGLVSADIADGERGDVQVGGVGIGLSGAAIAVGEHVTTVGATARLTPAAATEGYVGIARTAASGTGELIEVDLVERGGGPAMPT